MRTRVYMQILLAHSSLNHDKQKYTLRDHREREAPTLCSYKYSEHFVGSSVLFGCVKHMLPELSITLHVNLFWSMLMSNVYIYVYMRRIWR